MVPSQDSNPRPANRKSDALPIAGSYFISVVNCDDTDMVTLLAGHWTCNSQVAGSSPGWVPLGKLLHLCASVTKQYNLVLAKRGDAVHLGK